MVYGTNDMKQAALGALVAVIFFYLLRAGQPINIDPSKGLLVGIVWIWIASVSFLNSRRESKYHMVGNILITLLVSTTLAYIFDMITYNQIFSFEFFGTAAWLGVLLGLPAAQFFDRYNISNMYERWYNKKR